MKSAPIRAAVLAHPSWVMGLLALALRLVLTRVYWGSEEEDWGALGIILGTLRGGYVETEHMPLFAGLAALVTAVVGDPELGGELVAACAGAGAVALTTWLGHRWFSPAAGWLAGALLLAQPEAALYAATPLRTGPYLLLSVATVALAGSGRGWAAGLALSGAFLTRFDAAFTLLPAVALAATVGLIPRRPGLLTAALGAATVTGWAAWYHHDLGTWRFWGGVADRTAGDRLAWETLASFALRILPWHIGPAAVVLACAGGWKATRNEAAARWSAVVAVFLAGFLTLVLLVTGWRWDHNLYWKWMTPLVPWVALLAGQAAARRGRAAIAALLLGVWPFQAFELVRQLERSDAWYGTQVRFARWWDGVAPRRSAVLADLIPAMWFESRPAPRTVFRWSQGDVPGGDALGPWLVERGVGLLICFQEAWVPCADEGLRRGEGRTFGGVPVVPLAREDGYGFYAYAVGGPGQPATLPAPPADAGGPGATVAP